MKKIIKICFAFLATILAAVIYLSSFFSLFFSPWSPTRKRDIKRIIKALDIQPNDVIYDLGSGDGRVCIEIARRTSATVVGIEISFLLYILSHIRLFFSQLKGRVKFCWGNFYHRDISSANKVFIYLTKRTAANLSHKLFSQLRPGAIIVSYQYPISHFHYVKKIQRRRDEIPLYIYRCDPSSQKFSIQT